jgi:uridylate kinase
MCNCFVPVFHPKEPVVVVVGGGGGLREWQTFEKKLDNAHNDKLF